MTDISIEWMDGTPLKPYTGGPTNLAHGEDVAAAFMYAASLLGGIFVGRGVLCRYSVSSGRDVTPVEVVPLLEQLGARELGIKRGKRGFAAVDVARARPEPTGVGSTGGTRNRYFETAKEG
jgi:hypothetical protein